MHQCKVGPQSSDNDDNCEPRIVYALFWNVL